MTKWVRRTVGLFLILFVLAGVLGEIFAFRPTYSFKLFQQAFYEGLRKNANDPSALVWANMARGDGLMEIYENQRRICASIRYKIWIPAVVLAGSYVWLRKRSRKLGRQTLKSSNPAIGEEN